MVPSQSPKKRHKLYDLNIDKVQQFRYGVRKSHHPKTVKNNQYFKNELGNMSVNSPSCLNHNMENKVLTNSEIINMMKSGTNNNSEAEVRVKVRKVKAVKA